MTSRTIRALALAATTALLGACTSSAPTSTPSPAASSVPSPTPVSSPSPAPEAGAPWEVVTGVDAVSPSFIVAAMGVCRGPGYDARCGQHLMATQDAGRTWYELTPSALPHGAALEYPDFLDPTTGWVVAANCVGGEALLERTTDGGRTWTATQLGPQTCNAGARIVPDFVDPRYGWLLHVEPTAPFATLERTTDGGATWHRLSGQIVGAPQRAVLTSPTTGWMSGLGRGTLLRTTDGGRSWSPIHLPRPPSGISGAAYPDVPTRVADGSLVVPVTYRNPGSTTVAFDRSVDGGRTWTLVRTWSGHAAHRSPGEWSGLAVAVAGPAAFWIAPGTGGTVVRTDGSGWRTVAGGADPLAGIASASPSVAWALAHSGRALMLDRIGPHGTKELSPWPASVSPKSSGMTPIATLDGDASAIAGTPGAVYVALPRGLDTVLERRDPTTGRVLARATVPHGTSGGYGWTSLAASGDAVWLLTGKLHEYLVRLDPANLRIEQTQLLPHPAQGLAATVGGVWVGTGDRVVFHPASTGAALRSVTMPGATARVAVSPDQTSVYVSLSGPVRHNEDPLLQLDAATGAILARTYDGEADLDGYTSLAPTGDGIWFSVATGMQGGMSLLRAGTLAPVAKLAIRGSNKIVGTFADDRLWVSDYRRMTCNDPQTGQTLGYAGFPDRDGAAVVQAGTDVLTVLGRTLYRIDPSLAC